MMEFSFEEIRVLGALIEKELTTPDYYPLTINSLTTACNQKSNREPVVEFTQSQVMETIDGLMRKRVVGKSTGAGTRATKYRHALAEAWGLTVPERAVLSVLLLRGPQTSGELRARTTRHHPFESTDEIDEVLRALAEREDEPLVVEMERQPGKKEPRHAHLLSGAPPEDEAMPAIVTIAPAGGRIDQLEEDVARLREEIDALRAAFAKFRGQFE